MINGYLLGDKETIAKLEAMFPNMHSRLKLTIGQLVLRLAKHIKQDKLSGQVLRNRTGRLRRSITTRVQANATAVIGTVGTNVEYAAVHEYGFQGTVNIKAHLRKAKDRFIPVRAHTRQVNMPERSFLRSALRDLTPEIKEQIRDDLVATAKSILTP